MERRGCQHHVERFVRSGQSSNTEVTTSADGKRPSLRRATAASADGLSTTQSLRAWDLAARTVSPYLAILPILPMPAGAPRLSVFSEVGPAGAGADSPQQDVPPDWIQLPAIGIDARCPLVEMGSDSVMAMQIRGILRHGTGIGPPANLLWQHPTVQVLTTYIHQPLRGS
ncbi:acyl carrier protein [Streptomyces pinistramenti]|uniref:acyl carrier protein n=1 Tax=Streptomyces pinistramenti TaxID=2884812 RepID=UPI001D090584|nr:acyl carrier protein [Streptomyces pinistramenti]MCB5908841.1 acyl carrier protein [Streptomyces pinistramenti]